MSILLVRHGETDWNTERRVQGSTDIPLNENGKRQAFILNENLCQEEIKLSKIYSSYQKRALETAEIIGAQYNLSVKTLRGLEEMNLGLFEGHTWEEIAGLYPNELEKWTSDKRYIKTPEGECYQDVLERFFVAYDQILEDAKPDIQANEDILIVTHGAVIMSLLTVFNDLDFETSYTVIEVPNAKPVRLETDDFEKIRKKLH